MKFNKRYTQYWESAVEKSVDGTVIAGIQEVSHFFDKLSLNKNNRTLDLGCSTGRMFEVLSQYSHAVYGVEPDIYAVSKASSKKYKTVLQGTAEETGYPAKFFDFVFCWAVFDVVDHFEGLSEINRILNDDGCFFLTCKADSYDPSDTLAFKAEKNAYLKGFPNKFTNLSLLCRQIKKLGFELIDLVLFPNRGDMGILKYKRLNIQEISLSNSEVSIDGYEYLMIAKKVSDLSLRGVLNKEAIGSLDNPFSKTASNLALNAGFPSVKDYFESIGID